jgi:hypothetical protein
MLHHGSCLFLGSALGGAQASIVHHHWVVHLVHCMSTQTVSLRQIGQYMRNAARRKVHSIRTTTFHTRQ